MTPLTYEQQQAVKQAAYHDQFELVKTPLGFRAQHKVTGQSYQQHDISAGAQREVDLINQSINHG